jgi:diguanylate cyclase (GGDEF)-like protein
MSTLTSFVSLMAALVRFRVSHPISSPAFSKALKTARMWHAHGTWTRQAGNSDIEPTMNEQASRGLGWTGGRARRRALTILGFLGVLATIVGLVRAYVASGMVGAADTKHLLALLVFIAFVVACAGAALIRRTITALARTMEAEARQERLDEVPAAGLKGSQPPMNSSPRMPIPIDEQTAGLNGLLKPVDAANRDLESRSDGLQTVSFSDELTSLYNRRFFSIRLEEEVARHRRFARPLSLVLLDVDDFKPLDDAPGHRSKNQTLRQVADILQKNSRAVDVIFRYGDSAFAVLLVETPGEGARSYAEHIQKALHAFASDHERSITASLGVACCPDDVTTADGLTRAAEEALGSSKREGKNCVVVFTEAGERHPAEREVQA